MEMNALRVQKGYQHLEELNLEHNGLRVYQKQAYLHLKQH